MHNYDLNVRLFFICVIENVQKTDLISILRNLIGNLLRDDVNEDIEMLQEEGTRVKDINLLNRTINN